MSRRPAPSPRRCRSRRRTLDRYRRNGGLQPGQVGVDFALVQAIEHEGDVVEIVVQRIEQRGRRSAERFALGQAAFHQVRELAQSHRTGHARAALERVQRALESVAPGRTSAGFLRQARSCSPACGKSSAASSRKIGSTCLSTSSLTARSDSLSGNGAIGAGAGRGTTTGAVRGGGSTMARVTGSEARAIGAAAMLSTGSGVCAGAAAITSTGGASSAAAARQSRSTWPARLQPARSIRRRRCPRPAAVQSSRPMRALPPSPTKSIRPA